MCAPQARLGADHYRRCVDGPRNPRGRGTAPLSDGRATTPISRRPRRRETRPGVHASTEVAIDRPGAQYVSLPGLSCGSRGACGSESPLSSLFSITSSGANPTLSAKSRSFRFKNLARRGGFLWLIAGNTVRNSLHSSLRRGRKQAQQAAWVLEKCHVGALRTPVETMLLPYKIESVDTNDPPVGFPFPNSQQRPDRDRPGPGPAGWHASSCRRSWRLWTNRT
jgi:hypothetical protein